MSENTLRDRAVDNLRYARKTLNSMIEGIPEHQATTMPSPGLCNHLLWTLGHLAISTKWMGDMAGVAVGAMPASYDALFGMGSTPTPDAKAYPPLAEVRGHYERTFEEFVSGFSKLSGPDLLKAPMADTGGFAADRLALGERAAWHEGWHLGQMSLLRKALGLKPLYS